MKILTFTLNDINFGIPIKNVAYMEPIDGGMNLQEMSNTPIYIKGLALLHNISIPIYSLDLMFGFDEAEISYLIVINVDGIKLALGIDGDGEIIDVEEKEIFPLPTFIGTSQHYLKNIVEYRQKNLILLIDVNKLVT